jgi:hypothetical protein
MTHKPSPAEQLRRAMNVANRELEALSVEELEEILREAGADPDAEVTRTRELFRRAGKDVKQEALRAARAGFERSTARQRETEARTFELPATPEGRLALLQKVAALRHALPQPVTSKFRELDAASVSDNDVTRALEQMLELGLLDDLVKSGDLK